MLLKRIIGLQTLPSPVDQSHVMNVVNIAGLEQVLIGQRLLKLPEPVWRGNTAPKSLQQRRL